MDFFDILLAQRMGGGGGTSDYTQLSNKPQINGHELDGNKSGEDLELLSDHGGYTIVNGTRVYVGSVEPTGNIPDNSLWFGGVMT